MEIEIGIGKSGRQAYGFDDIAIVPSRRTRDPDDVDISWQLDGFRFPLPMMGSAMDSAISPATAITIGKLGGLAVLNLEGLWTRYEDPQPYFDEIAELTKEKATLRMQEIYLEPVNPDLIGQRIAEIKAAGVVTAGSLTPQRVRSWAPSALKAGLDIMVIQGTVVSAEHVSSREEPLNLKEYIANCEVPVIVGGCASYSTALHLMRTGAVGVLVGVGPGAACTTRGVLGVGVPQATAIADAAGARIRYLDETGRYVHVIADGGMRTGGDVAKAIACGADAVMIGSPLASASEAPGRGYHWGMATFHPTLPRGARVEVGDRGTLAEILVGPAHENDGRLNLFGALTVSMATTGYSDVKEFQKAEVMIAPSIQTEGKSLQRNQRVGMGWWSSTPGRDTRRKLRPTGVCLPEALLARPRVLMSTEGEPRAKSAGEELVLVLDFGAQYAQLIARRVREAHVYSEVVSRDITADEIRARRPIGLILSGGPASVYAEDAYRMDPSIIELGIPVLGICYGHQLLADLAGGEVANTGTGEYGNTSLEVTGDSLLLQGLPTEQGVWMSHQDQVTAAPEGFAAVARTSGSRVAAMEDRERGLYGVQFHPEVGHTPRGTEILKRFLYDVCHASPTWTSHSIIESQVASIKAQVGGERVVCGLSGGVDSAVAAALVHSAVGDQLTCIFVDHGLLRLGEAEQVEHTFRSHFTVDLIHVKVEDRFLEALAGVTDPEEKRMIIGETFIRVFEEAAESVGDARFLVQGHALSRRDRVRLGLGSHHQDPSQRRRPARRHDVRADRALAGPVQGRSQGGGRGAWPARGDRLASALPRPRPGGAGDRGGDPRASRPASGRRPDRCRGDPSGRSLSRDLAGVRGPARGEDRRSPRRWAYLRLSPDRAGGDVG